MVSKQELVFWTGILHPKTIQNFGWTSDLQEPHIKFLGFQKQIYFGKTRHWMWRKSDICSILHPHVWLLSQLFFSHKLCPFWKTFSACFLWLVKLSFYLTKSWRVFFFVWFVLGGYYGYVFYYSCSTLNTSPYKTYPETPHNWIY